MLPRNRRLSTKLFEEVMNGGKSFHAAHFSLRVSKITLAPSKFGFGVPKKLDTRATYRNLLRRRCTASLQKHLKNVPDGYAGIFFAKKGALELSPAHIEEEIGFLIKKAFSSVITSV